MQSASAKAPSSSVVIKFVSVPSRQEPGRGAGDFVDCLNDMHVPPDQVRLRTVCNGQNGLVRDAENIRNYFRNALSEMPAE